MSRNQNTIALVEASLLTALTAILAIAGFYLPLLGYLLFIIAVPFVILGVRHSRRYVFISSLAAAVLVSFLTFPTYGIYIAVMGGAVGLVMAHHIKARKDSSTVIFFGALMTTIGLIILLSLTTLISGVGIMDLVSEVLDETVLLTETLGMSEWVANSEVSFAEIAELVKMVIPSSLILSGAIFAVMNYLVASIILKRMGTWTMPPKPFSQFTLPSNILFGTTLILVLTYLAGRVNLVDSGVLFVNVLNVFIYVFLVQGIAVIFHWLEKRELGRGFKIAVVVVVFVSGMTMAAALIGWLDSAFDFRKIRKRD